MVSTEIKQWFLSSLEHILIRSIGYFVQKYFFLEKIHIIFEIRSRGAITFWMKTCEILFPKEMFGLIHWSGYFTDWKWHQWLFTNANTTGSVVGNSESESESMRPESESTGLESESTEVESESESDWVRVRGVRVRVRTRSNTGV